MEEEIIYFYNFKDGKYYQSRYTHRWLNNLQQQCKKQKEAIDKAIEYIENKVISSGEVIDQLRKVEVKELLNILKEVK